jgi:hypothetical protein
VTNGRKAEGGGVGAGSVAGPWQTDDPEGAEEAITAICHFTDRRNAAFLQTAAIPLAFGHWLVLARSADCAHRATELAARQALLSGASRCLRVRMATNLIRLSWKALQGRLISVFRLSAAMHAQAFHLLARLFSAWLHNDAREGFRDRRLVRNLVATLHGHWQKLTAASFCVWRGMWREHRVKALAALLYAIERALSRSALARSDSIRLAMLHWRSVHNKIAHLRIDATRKRKYWISVLSSGAAKRVQVQLSASLGQLASFSRLAGLRRYRSCNRLWCWILAVPIRGMLVKAAWAAWQRFTLRFTVVEARTGEQLYSVSLCSSACVLQSAFALLDQRSCRLR